MTKSTYYRRGGCHCDHEEGKVQVELKVPTWNQIRNGFDLNPDARGNEETLIQRFWAPFDVKNGAWA